MNILEMARAFMFQAKLPLKYWGDCVLAATNIINRFPNSFIEDNTPYEMVFEKKLDYVQLKVFGCLAMSHNESTKHDKFCPRGVPCTFLEYPSTNKGYKLMNMLTQQLFLSRDVKFYENE